MALSQEIKDAICELVADGQSMRQIRAVKDMPALSTIFVELARDPEFAEQYTRAREIGIDSMAQDLMQIANTPQIGEIRTVKADGSVELKQVDMIEHRRLQVDSRKWLLSKLAPKKYGDKIDHNLSGDLTINWPVPASRVER